jgi:hypothetical protein
VRLHGHDVPEQVKGPLRLFFGIVFCLLLIGASSYAINIGQWNSSVQACWRGVSDRADNAAAWEAQAATNRAGAEDTTASLSVRVARANAAIKQQATAQALRSRSKTATGRVVFNCREVVTRPSPTGLG